MTSEVRYSRHMDLASAVGFLVAFQACRRLVRNGLLYLGTPCSQWIWLSRGSTGRCRLRPGGDKKIPSVRATNRLVRRLCFLFLGKELQLNPITQFGGIMIFVLHSHCPSLDNKECSGVFYWNIFYIQKWMVSLGAYKLKSGLNFELRLEYCRKKGIHWMIEQPASSLLPLYKPLEAFVLLKLSNGLIPLSWSCKYAGFDQETQGQVLLYSYG